MAKRATRVDTCAGGVVYRHSGGRIELALGEERDRLTGNANVRLAKGHVEAGESLEEAALREVREEIGIAATVVAELGSVEYTFEEPGGSVAKVVHFFLMEALAGAAGSLDGEMRRMYWCESEEAGDHLTFATERRIVERARQAIAKRSPG
jgi:8-oxo-dGTP pyrophosphatase MutT (NUDIX family)